MKHICLSTAALLLSGTAALAELAPQDVLDSWRGFYAGFGATISTSAPVVTGNTTRFANVFTQMDMAGAEARYSFDWIDMQRHADGSIDITFSPTGYATTFTEISGETLESQASYDLGSLTIHAEGTPEDIRFSYDAPVITLHQSQSLPDVDISTTIALQNLQGSVRSGGAGGQITDAGGVTFDSLSAKLTFKPQTGQPTYLDYRTETAGFDFDVSMPQTPIPETPQTMLLYPEDMLFGLTLRTGPATTRLKQPTARGEGVLTFAQASGALTAAYAENALSYSITAGDAALSLANTPAQPVDFTAAFARFHLGATFPMRKSESPSPFALAVALEGFTVGEEIWAKIDPNATLSRTPASFAFSINGTLKLFADLFDQTALTALRGAPFELRSLSLDALSLDVEGMGLTGEGAVTFNNERMDPMSGLPEPTGVLDFSINGALGMLDKIGRLGLIEPMVIIGAKGALGMFATPNDGPDSFTSRIEFTDGGQVSVNGQQVK